MKAKAKGSAASGAQNSGVKKKRLVPVKKLPKQPK